jgi:hypothetical protein
MFESCRAHRGRKSAAHSRGMMISVRSRFDPKRLLAEPG